MARSRDLGTGDRRGLRLGESEVVLYRTESGRLVALDAHCPHMGAHLRHGKVIGEELQCAMHHWLINVEGQAHGPCGSCRTIRSWQVVERCELVFLYLGARSDQDRAEPVCPAQAAEFVWRSLGPVRLATSWHTLMISGFDMEHLRAVHHRELEGPPEIDAPAGNRLRLRYRSKVVGRGLSDRVMRWLGRGGIEVTMTCSGPIFVVETRLGRRRTAAILGLLAEGTGAVAHGSFGVPRSSWASGLQVRIASWLFLSFLARDFEILEGAHFALDVDDVGVRAMTRFLEALPEARRG